MPCRSCGESQLQNVLSLGRTPLANALLPREDLARAEEAFPLDLAFCPACSLVQIVETVPSEKMFRDYVYFSSFSEGMLKHAEEHVRRLIETAKLGKASLAIESASNDGYLLQNFVKAGVPVLGIEPARNIAKVAEGKGIRTRCEFFTRELASALPQADVVIANNVLAHVPDLNGFIAGIRTVLKPDGVATVEVPYVRDMVDHCEFDTIYHEHLSYFSVTALDALISRNGLVLDRVERLALHGGSLLLFLRHRKSDRSTVEAILREEAAWGVGQLLPYRVMAHRVAGMKESLRGLLSDLKGEGRRIAAYGAAAKGATLLNYFRIGTEWLDYVVDRSPHKQGKFMPGSRLPIEPVERLVERKPDYVLLLAWNFADEILRQQEAYRRSGGRFIVAVPELRVL
jgi:SAM-dependent methyltransferase